MIFALVLHLLLLLKLNFFQPFIGGNLWLYDFDIYYHLAQDLLRGINPYSVSYMQTWGPPIGIIPYIPFTLLSLNIARSLATTISIFSGYLSCVLLARKYFPKNQVSGFLMLSTVLFSAFTTRFNFITGQSGLWLMFLATYCLIGKNNYLKALSWATALSLKSFLLLSTTAWLKTSRKLLYYTTIFLGIIFLCSLLFIDFNWYVTYLNNRLGQSFSPRALLANLDYYNQTLASFLSRLGLWQISNTVQKLSFIVGPVIIFLAGSLELGIVISLLVSPIVWQHYFVILFPIFINTFFELATTPKRRLIILLIFIFWWIEFPWIHDKPVNFWWGIIGSHYFLSGLGLAIAIFFWKKSKSN
jgi:hypothetical protein